MPQALVALFISAFICATVSAEPDLVQEIKASMPEEVKPLEPRDWRIVVALGYQNQFQKSVDGNKYDNSNQRTFTYGFQKNSFQYTFTWFSSEEVSSNGNLFVESGRQTLQFDGHYLSKPWGGWTPLLGASLAAYRDEVFTRFDGQTFSAESEIFAVAGLSAGVQFRFFKVGYADLMVKALKRETSTDVEWASHTTLGLRL